MINKNKIRYIDLFSGAGGLSEGFIRCGYEPIAHVEIDEAACNTLKTRMARHWLNNNSKYETYEEYLHGKLTRRDFWKSVPDKVINSVINIGIGKENNPTIFSKIDSLKSTGNVDLIIGGPPCQAYSLAGRSRDMNGMKNDERNYLYKFYADFLIRYKPTYFVFENVLGLLSARDKNGNSYFDKMKNLFKSIGYKIKYEILDSSMYGIPQKRKRIILVGKFNSEPVYPFPDKISSPLSINDLFSDLPKIKAGSGTHKPSNYINKPHSYVQKIKLRQEQNYVTWHVSRPNRDQDLEIYRIAVEKWYENKRLNYNELKEELKTHKNRNSHVDRFKVVAGNLNYSHTVVAHIAKDGHYYIHPDIKQNRSLTPREAARLQTFPDDYYFEGVSEKPSRTAAFKQIGNAVPVILGEKIAKKLKEVW